MMTRWLFSLLIVAVCAVSRAIASDPPNVVLIITDDQAWTDYGFMGHQRIETPNLDRLAARSAVFTRGYVPTALCRPSLATIVTGLYPHQHRICGNDPSRALAPPNSPQYAELRSQMIRRIDDLPTLPKLLAERGYLSHQSGKWWEGSFKRGGFTHGMTRGFPEAGGRHGDDGLRIGREGMTPIFEFIDDATSQRKPFFVWYAPFLPHKPHNPPARLVEKYQRMVDSRFVARYYAMCEWFDETCGELLTHLEQQGIADNTLIVYIGDNGWIQNRTAAGFAPRSKLSPNEAGIRQPILLSWPGVIPPGRRDELVSSIDLAPTILSAAGATIPDGLPGINLLPVVRDGKPLGRDTIFGEGYTHDVPDLDNPAESLQFRWAIEGPWKLLLTYDNAIDKRVVGDSGVEMRPQLFELSNDLHETKNVAAQNPEVVARLAKKIAAWWPLASRDAITQWTEAREGK